MHHEAPGGLSQVEGLHALLVFLGAQRGGDQRLGLAAGEQRRAVHTGEYADLDGDVADLVHGAAVGDAGEQNLINRRKGGIPVQIYEVNLPLGGGGGGLGNGALL